MHKVLFILLGGLMLATVAPAENAADASALAGRTGGVQSHLLQKQRARHSGSKAAGEKATGESTKEEASSKKSQNALARKVGGPKTRLLYQLRHRHQLGTPAAPPAAPRLSMLS